MSTYGGRRQTAGVGNGEGRLTVLGVAAPPVGRDDVTRKPRVLAATETAETVGRTQGPQSVEVQEVRECPELLRPDV